MRIGITGIIAVPLLRFFVEFLIVRFEHSTYSKGRAKKKKRRF